MMDNHIAIVTGEGPQVIRYGGYVDPDVVTLFVTRVRFDYNAAGLDSIALWANPHDPLASPSGLGTPDVSCIDLDIGTGWSNLSVEVGSGNSLDAVRISSSTDDSRSSLARVMGGSCFQAVGTVGGCSFNGGRLAAGGADIQFDTVTAPGDLTAWSGAVPLVDLGRISNVLIHPGTIHFALWMDPVRFFGVGFLGAFQGSVTLTLGYGSAPPGRDETRLAVYHYEGGAWSQVATDSIDTTNHWIRVRTKSLSPFAIGVAPIVPSDVDTSPDNCAGLRVRVNSSGYPQALSLTLSALSAATPAGSGGGIWVESA